MLRPKGGPAPRSADVYDENFSVSGGSGCEVDSKMRPMKQPEASCETASARLRKAGYKAARLLWRHRPLLHGLRFCWEAAFRRKRGAAFDTARVSDESLSVKTLTDVAERGQPGDLSLMWHIPRHEIGTCRLSGQAGDAVRFYRTETRNWRRR